MTGLEQEQEEQVKKQCRGCLFKRRLKTELKPWLTRREKDFAIMREPLVFDPDEEDDV